MNHSQHTTPLVFVSYSWGSAEHTAWVLSLATRLRSHGVDVVLDRWDTELGSDLSLFMERAGHPDYRVIAVCSEEYSEKANGARGGVGYERKMITPSLIADLHGNRVIPILRDNPSGTLPRFLGAAKYVDLRSDPYDEAEYLELLQALLGMPPTPKPPLGQNPFTILPADEVPSALRHDHTRYAQPALEGTVAFAYHNNDGHYVIGAGQRTFTLKFSEASHGSIHAYSDPPDIKSVALAPGVADPEHVGDASAYDTSSRSRTARVGDTIILRNTNGYWAAVFVDAVQVRDTGPTGEPVVTFRYLIPPVPSPLFESGHGA